MRFPRPRRARGFALIVTIVLVAFLVLILVGLATFTRVETQVASNTQQLSQARQNALMALNLAIGELQRTAGPDQRVTAPSNLAPAALASGVGSSDEQPFITGVWRHEAGTATDLPTRAYSPRLVSWLVSGNENMAETAAPPVTPASIAALPVPAAGNDVVWLVNTNTVEQSGTISAANPDRRIRLNTTPIRAAAGSVPGFDATGPDPTIGHYAWWVGDEGVKARLDLIDPYAAQGQLLNRTGLSADETAARVSSLQSANPRLLNGAGGAALSGFPVNDPVLRRLVTREQLPFIGTGAVANPASWRQNFHGVTPHSFGLLTDTRAGGLRQDMSYLLSRTTLGAFRTALGQSYNPIVTGYNPGANTSNQIVQPGVSVPAWMPAFPSAGTLPPVGPTWEQLWSYSRMPTEVTGPGTGVLEARTQTQTRHGFSPVLLQAKVFFGIRRVPTGVDETYNLHLHIFPVFVLGNPHSVAMHGTFNINFVANNAVRWRARPEPDAAPPDTGFAALGLSDLNNVTFRIVVDASDPLPAGGARAYSLETGLSGNGWDASSFSYLFATNGVYLMGDYSTAVSLRHVITDGDGVPVVRVGPDSESPALLVNGALRALAILWDGSPSGHETVHQFYNSELAVDTAAAWASPRIGNSDEIARGNGYQQRHIDQFDGPLGPPAPPGSDNVTSGIFGDTNMRATYLRPSVNTTPAASGTGFNSSDSHSRYPLFTNGRFWRNHSFFDGVNDRITVRPDNKTVPWVTNYKNTGAGGPPLIDTNILFTIPRQPLNSIAQLQHFNASGYLHTGSQGFNISFGSVPAVNSFAGRIAAAAAYQVPYPIGNSAASKFIAREALERDTTLAGVYRDASYLLNSALWDRFHFSSFTYASSDSNDFNDRNLITRNHRHTPFPNAGAPVTVASTTPSTAATRLGVAGAFNVNSTSVEAWTAFLGGMLGVSFSDSSDVAIAPFPRSLAHTSGSANAGGGVSDNAWAGHRPLTRAELETLATEIVEQVKARGPFLSLADFVNRRLIAAADDAAAPAAGARDLRVGLGGVLHQAIRSANLNGVTNARYSPAPPNRSGNVADPAHLQPHRIVDFPGWVTQADLLQSIGPALSARSDTFVIRTYGDVRNPATGEIEGRAWCEAVVQRRIDYVNPADAADASLASLSQESRDFGRRFEIISFRWLDQNSL